MASQEYAKGLEGVIAAESGICKVEGERGDLYYRGYSIFDLTEHCTFEEVTYLLLYGRLPAVEQLELFSQRMRRCRDLPLPVLDMIRSFPSTAHPMELLQAVISYLSGYVGHSIQHSALCNCRDTLHQVAQLSSVVAALYRFRNGDEYVAPHPQLSHGANFLYMLRGTEPDEREGEIMDACLILHAEHGFNASTFTARVVASTLSTCYCSIASAIGSLYGSLHGGANERVVAMLHEIGDRQHVAGWLERAFAEKRKIMGMGHRVYRVTDPRARIIERFLEEISLKKGDTAWYDMLREIEHGVGSREGVSGKPIYPNVDFFSGALYLLLGIPPVLFTPVFAMARVAGWLAHILEQRSDNRIYRPRCLYAGPEPRPFVPREKRKVEAVA